MIDMKNCIIEPGEILIGTDADSQIQGPYRVLSIKERVNQVVMIPIPIGPRKMNPKRQASYYALGFKSFDLKNILFLLETKKLKKPL